MDHHQIAGPDVITMVKMMRIRIDMCIFQNPATGRGGIINKGKIVGKA